MARGDGRIYLRGTTYWCAYYLRNMQYRESAHTDDEKEALRFLRKRVKEVHADEIGARTFTTPKATKLTVHDLLESLKANLELKGKASAQNLSHLRRADADFGSVLATTLTPARIDAYKRERVQAHDAPASINRTLQFVRQAFRLAQKCDLLPRVPYIELLNEAGNTRTGFCEEAQFRKVYSSLPDYLKDFALFAYCTGMRFGEVRSLRWEFVRNDMIELQGKDAKNGHARLIPMVGSDLAGVLERRRSARQVETATGTTMAAYIFHHDGNPIVDIRKAWKTACRKAGVSGLLFHDLRRSAVRNLDLAGISRDVAMSISGHKTQSMFTRYNIADVTRRRSALELAQQFRDSQTEQATKVVSIKKANG